MPFSPFIFDRKMKHLLPFFIMSVTLMTTCSQQQTQMEQQTTQYPLPADVGTIDGLIKASYEVVSGEKGAPRQWERDQSLHHPKAIYSYTPRGTHKQVTMSLKEFHGETDDLVLADGFFENEIGRKVQLYGNMAHVWSAYETRTAKNGPVVARGINSIQLYNDGHRWWIVSWVFDRESPDNKIPKDLIK